MFDYFFIFFHYIYFFSLNQAAIDFKFLLLLFSLFLDIHNHCNNKNTIYLYFTNVNQFIDLHKFRFHQFDVAQNNCDPPYHDVSLHGQNVPLD